MVTSFLIIPRRVNHYVGALFSTEFSIILSIIFGSLNKLCYILFRIYREHNRWFIISSYVLLRIGLVQNLNILPLKNLSRAYAIHS